jgi:hypothetical protein
MGFQKRRNSSDLVLDFEIEDQAACSGKPPLCNNCNNFFARLARPFINRVSRTVSQATVSTNPTEAEYLIVNATPASPSKKTHRERMVLLDKAHLIVYVCASYAEAERARGPIKLDSDEYHHEFNSLHHLPKFKNRTILATFDESTTPNNAANCLALPRQNKYLVLFMIENKEQASQFSSSLLFPQRCLLQLYIRKLNIYLKGKVRKASLTRDWRQVELVDNPPEKYLDEFELKVESEENKLVGLDRNN